MTSTAELHKRRYDLIVNIGLLYADMINDPNIYDKFKNTMISFEKELSEINKILNLERNKND